jgi:hypothetical protein
VAIALPLEGWIGTSFFFFEWRDWEDIGILEGLVEVYTFFDLNLSQ